MTTPRKYPKTDIKILYGSAAGRCAFPNCRCELILKATSCEKRKQIGKIAHIVGHSDDGPRGDSSYPREKLDTYDNWILLCPTCHDIVDALDSIYTIQNLRQIKTDHEKWVKDQTRDEVINITFAELSVVTKYLVSGQSVLSSSLTVIPPKEKIEKNALSSSIEQLITMGMTQVRQVGDFISKCPDIDFGDRLKKGFVTEYERLRNEEKLKGDDLFDALLDFASNQDSDFKNRAAGLAVLVYLFEKCEVFEK
jgi:hypothetical protein